MLTNGKTDEVAQATALRPQDEREGNGEGDKIVVEGLYKVFGPRAVDIARRLRDGEFSAVASNVDGEASLKKHILEQTGHTLAIHDVSFTVKPGELFVIMGLSGSGKSTLVRCINRLVKPTLGRILIDGEDVVAMDEAQLRHLRRHKVNMVFQGFGLFSHRTVLGNVEFGLEIRNVPANVRREKAIQALEAVGLQGWEHHYPEALSGGMRQRVGLARALATDPDILLMDEPFSALDPLIRREMQHELLELQVKLKKTILFITHDLDEAIRLGDRIAVMRDGRIVQLADPETILTRPEPGYVAEFVRDVDATKILTAAHVMRYPHTFARLQDGPGVALRKMRQEGINSLYILDRERRLVGLVMADDAARALQEGVEDLRQIALTDIPIVSPDTPFHDLLPISVNSRIPVAVVDENGVLRGIVVRASIIAGMMHARNGGGDVKKKNG